MHKNFLKHTTTFLNDAGYPTIAAQLVESSDVYQLTISLPQALPLQIVGFFLSELLRLVQEDEETSGSGLTTNANDPDFLQLFIRFPFDFEESSAADLARLMLMINWSTPVGSFGINETQKIVYYRQVFEWRNGQEDVGLVLDAVSAMEFYANLRHNRIRSIASGELTMAGLLREMEEKGTRKEEFPGYDL